MPCRYDGSPEGNTRYFEEQLGRVTRVACEALRFLEDDGRLPDLSPELRRWWKQHKATDRRRREAEQEIARRKVLRKKALARLSPAEKRALGLG